MWRPGHRWGRRVLLRRPTRSGLRQTWEGGCPGAAQARGAAGGPADQVPAHHATERGRSLRFPGLTGSFLSAVRGPSQGPPDRSIPEASQKVITPCLGLCLPTPGWAGGECSSTGGGEETGAPKPFPGRLVQTGVPTAGVGRRLVTVPAARVGSRGLVPRSSAHSVHDRPADAVWCLWCRLGAGGRWRNTPGVRGAHRPAAGSPLGVWSCTRMGPRPQSPGPADPTAV